MMRDLRGQVNIGSVDALKQFIFELNRERIRMIR
jgi:hypothetical protein